MKGGMEISKQVIERKLHSSNHWIENKASDDNLWFDKDISNCSGKSFLYSNVSGYLKQNLSWGTKQRC